MLPVIGKQITVVGAGRSGIAVARLLAAKGAEVFLTDRGVIKAEGIELLRDAGVEFESGEHTRRAQEADWVVISPGVPSDAGLVVDFVDRSVPVVSEIEVASWFCEAPIVAVTGSNGKTTTSSIAAHFLKASGRETHLAGNIGLAFSDVVNTIRREDVVVLEVSSFQLDHIVTFRPRVSLLLNITPDHLDRYGDSFEAYTRSKLRIFENQTSGDAAVVNIDDDVVSATTGAIPENVEILEISLDKEVPSGAFARKDELIVRYDNKEETLMYRQEVSIKGRHNMYNTLAAAVAARIMEVRSDVIRESMATFQGVPHRLELVREVDGVKYYNDSKATNVNAAWYALESFGERIILIAGGRDKGNDYEPLRKLVRDKVHSIVAIGEAAEKIIDDIGCEADTAVKAETLREAVEIAKLMADQGDVVLLSPACASFDQFENFEDRGNTFKRIVAEL